jgi:hypothetical protein
VDQSDQRRCHRWQIRLDPAARYHNQVEPGGHVLTVASKCFAQEPFPAIPQDGRADFSRHGKAESAVGELIGTDIDDQHGIRHALPVLKDPLELPGVPQSAFGG